MSLQARCMLYHRQFPERKISVTLLRKVYRLHGIRKKVIRWTKPIRPSKAKKYGKVLEELRQEVEAAEAEGYEVCYTDECMFSRKSVPKIEWAQRKTNLDVDMTLLNEPAYALLLAVSAERGVVCQKIYKKSVNIEKCLDWIQKLHEESPGRKLCLFWDNLSVHHSKRVLDRLEELGIKVIFNLSYSP